MSSHREYTDETHSSFTVPCRMTPGALGVLMNTLSNMYPAQFIVNLELHYQEDYNETSVSVITNGERWPGQFSGVERDVMGGNGSAGTRRESATGSVGGDSDGNTDSP